MANKNRQKQILTLSPLSGNATTWYWWYYKDAAFSIHHSPLTIHPSPFTIHVCRFAFDDSRFTFHVWRL